MDPLLKIIKYLFEKAGHANNDESINEFFDNGYSFPQLIALIFQIDQIPEAKKKPHSQYFKRINNKLALEFIFGKNREIANLSPNYQTEKDRIDLIKLILTKQCFETNVTNVIKQTNEILKSININCETLTDIMKPTILLSLLSVLTDNLIPTDTDPKDINFNFINNSFQKANVPIVINEDSFKIENQDVYLIQLQIIFQTFSEKIINDQNSEDDQISSGKSAFLNRINTNIEIENDEEIDEEGKKVYQDDEYFLDKNSHEKFITNLDFSIKDWYPLDAREDEALLLTIGFLSEQLKICSRDKIKTFEFLLLNNFVPLFVMRYLNIKKIDGLKKINRTESSQLTHQEITNIKLVIEHLKKREKKFELLIFDFDSPYLFVNSVKSFFKAFLNTYFVKMTRIEMMERANNFLSDLVWYSKEKLYTERQYDLFSGLLLFIELVKKNDQNPQNTNNVFNHIKSKENNFCIFFKDFSIMFQRCEVPQVVGMDIIDQFKHDSDLPDSLYYQQSDKELPDSIIFQLQFIFDKLDSLQSIHVVEHLMYINHKIKRLKIPPSDIIVSSVKSKIQFLKMKNKIKLIDQKELNEKKKELEDSFNKKEIEPKTFNIRQKSSEANKNLTKDNEMKKEEKSIENSETSEISEINEIDSFKYWNPPESNHQVENGILYSKSEPSQFSIEFLNRIKEADETIQKKMNFKKEKTIRKKTLKPDQTPSSSQQQQREEESLNFQFPKRNSTYNFETKLYKIFVYDETKLQWKFNSDTFTAFSEDKKINVEGSRTPLIFYFNSNEEDLVSINSHFIMGLYPPVNQDENQIFIYPLCEKQLSKINTTTDFSNQDKMLIKPIFLLIHIPKEKQNQPFIRTAVFQIYILFSKISDISICIYNETFIKNQIEMMNEIFSVLLHAYHMKKDKLSSILLRNNPNAEYKYSYDDQVHQLSTIKKNEDINIHYYLANFENFDSYKPFLDFLTRISLESKTTFSEVNKYFNTFEIRRFSGIYINIYSATSWKDELRKIIENRFLILKSKDSKFEKNPENVLLKLHEEFTMFSPLTDEEFINECNLNYISMRKTFTKIKGNIIQEELQKSSIENLQIFEKFLKEKNYLTKNQISNMIKSHEIFLRKEYFNIIKVMYDPKLFPLIYKDNKEDVLESQIKNDGEKIKTIAYPILESFNVKNTIKKVDAEESSKKGTNYSLKETENLRELKIEVKTVDKLETVIEQDF